MSRDSLRRTLNAVYTIWYRDVVSLIRDRSRLIGTLVANLFILFGFGFGMGGALGKIGGGGGLLGVTYSQFLFPMILCSIAMMTALPSTMSIVYDREFGFMKRILVAPISRISVVLGKVLGGVSVALVQVAVFMLAGPFLGVSYTLGTATLAVAILILVSAVVTAIGIVVAARQRTQQGFQVISMFVVMPLMLLTFGAGLPSIAVGSGMLSKVIRMAEWINPIAYGMDALRQVMLGTVSSSLAMLSAGLDVAVMFVCFAGLMVAGVALFSKQD